MLKRLCSSEPEESQPSATRGCNSHLWELAILVHEKDIQSSLKKILSMRKVAFASKDVPKYKT